MFAVTFEYVSALACSILLWLKLWEVASSLHWALRHGQDYAAGLRQRMHASDGKGISEHDFEDLCRTVGRPIHLQDWPTTGRLSSLPEPLRAISLNYVFRLPTLIIAESAYLCVGREPGLLLIGCALVSVGVWIEVAHILVNRLQIGFLDQAFSRTVSIRLLPFADVTPQELEPQRQQVVRRFVNLFGWLVVLTLTGYTGLYAGLQRAGAARFVGLGDGPAGVVDSFYFAVVTMGTVGYGDVRPDPTSAVAKLVVASQILVSFSLVVLLLTTFTLTVDSDE